MVNQTMSANPRILRTHCVAVGPCGARRILLDSLDTEVGRRPRGGRLGRRSESARG